MKDKADMISGCPIGWVLAFIVTLAGTGCTSTTQKVFNEKTYTLGSTVKVSEGKLLASELHGTVESTQSWVGVFKSDDGWGTAKLEFSNDYLEKKLFYLGYKEPYLYLLYREYRKGASNASVDKIEKFDANESPFIQVNDFYLKALTLKDSQMTFNILNKESYNSKKTEYAVSKKNQDEQDELDKAFEAVNRVRNKASDAKQSAEQLTQIISTSDSFSKATNEFDALNAAFDEAAKKKYSTSQSIEIYRTFETRFDQSAKFFTRIATAVKAWSAMDDDFKNAAHSGVGKDYFKMALEIKKAGELELQQEQYEQATERFLEAREEITRISDHFKNQTTEEPL